MSTVNDVILSDINEVFNAYPEATRMVGRLHSIDRRVSNMPEPMGNDYYGSIHLTGEGIDGLMSIMLYKEEDPNFLYPSFLTVQEDFGKRSWIKADKENHSFSFSCEGHPAIEGTLN